MIDLSYVKTTIGNDKKIIQELINLFTAQLPEFKNNIVDSYKIRNWKALYEAAHRAKNSFQILGIKDIAAELYLLEKLAAENNNNPEIKILIDNFVKACELVSNEIKTLII